MAIVFVGFDSVTTYSEETVNPEKTMPKAVLIICIGAAIEFIIVAGEAVLEQQGCQTNSHGKQYVS